MMEVEIYDEFKKPKKGLALLKLRRTGTTVYLDALDVEGRLRGVIGWVDTDGKVMINTGRVLLALGLEFDGQRRN